MKKSEKFDVKYGEGRTGIVVNLKNKDIDRLSDVLLPLEFLYTAYASGGATIGYEMTSYTDANGNGADAPNEVILDALKKVNAFLRNCGADAEAEEDSIFS